MNPPIRIAMLLSNAFRPDPRVHKEARSLARAGHTVTVICWDRQGEFAPREYLDGFEIRRLAIRSAYGAGSRQLFYLPRFWRRALLELGTLKPHLIHCHDLDTTLPGYGYALTHRLPWIFDAHECYPEQMRAQVNPLIYRGLQWLEKIMTQRATCVITVGNLLAKHLESLGGRVTIVGNYQPLGDCGPGPLSRAAIGLKQDDFVTAYIGGFTRERLILPLIEATQYHPDLVVLILGDGPQRPAIETVLPSYPNVHYKGWAPLEQVPYYTALADVIYYGLDGSDKNSQYSTPNALFNALAAGKPLLTTNVGEIAHIVRQEQCGIVVEQPSPYALAQALLQLRDPSLRATLGVNARRAAQSRYNWAIAEATLLDVYQQLCPCCKQASRSA